MPPPIQNKEFIRAEHEILVHYRPKGEEKIICGIMRNYSETGICFDTGYPIRPGTEIFFIIENVFRNPDISYNGEANYAEVEWCQAPANCDACFYKVGAKFFNL